jgi:hypothetical protein
LCEGEEYECEVAEAKLSEVVQSVSRQLGTYDDRFQEAYKMAFEEAYNIARIPPPPPGWLERQQSR